MLNLTRLHLGIAHESQFQGLGIRYASAAKAAPMPPSCSAHWDGLRKKAASPRASGSTWRKPSHRPEGNAVRRATQIEGSIMDPKTGANIKTVKFARRDRRSTFPIYDATIC